MNLSTLRARGARLHQRRRQRRHYDRVIAPRFDAPLARDPRYERAVQRYWRERLGRTVDTRWHLAFRERLGIEDPRFLPTLEWYHDIVPALNNPRMRRSHLDKNLAEVLLGPLHTPENVLRRIHGHYLDGDFRPLSRREAAARLGELDERVLLKESLIDNGDGVHLLSPGEGPGLDGTVDGLASLERRHGANFLVQRYLVQHPALAAPHPTSVNTLRVMTLRLEEGIHHLGSYVRFGRGGALIDNGSAGGLACAVAADHALGELAAEADGRMHATHPDTGYAFAGQRLPGVEEAISQALSLHGRLHHMDFVCWDFAIDAEARPRFIEMNFRGRVDGLQFVCRRPLFGELTDAVLARVRPTLRG